MELKSFFISLAVMASVTYLIRMLPMVLFKKKIKSRFIRSFLYYIPYGVLSAMTIPSILYSTSSFAPSLAGLIVAVIMAFFERNLVSVAACACIASLIMERIIVLAF